MRLTLVAPALAALLIVAACPSEALARSSFDPSVNSPVVTNLEDQNTPVILSDGAGGAFIAFYEWYTAGPTALRVQHLLSTGAVDPGWLPSGRVITSEADTRMPSPLATDGTTGVLVGFSDSRTGRWHPYGQRVNADGSLAWLSTGATLCLSNYQQYASVLEPDGAGGAHSVWNDFRGATGYDIYAAHVDANGGVTPGAPYNGIPVCVASGGQYEPRTAPDGAGGVLVTWRDYRTGTVDPDIYAHHLLADGTVDPAWPANGRAVIADVGAQDNARIASDGVGGAFIAWRDTRWGDSNQICAQHMLAGGTLDPAWPVGGLRVNPDPTVLQMSPVLIAAGSGDAIVLWIERDATGTEVRALRLLPTGVPDPTWPAGGASTVGANAGEWDLVAMPDPAGGAIAVWTDDTPGWWERDIRAMHFDERGLRESGWPASGLPVSSAASAQAEPAICTDGAGGAIVAWADQRNANYDIYAQRVPITYPVSTPPAPLASRTALERPVPNPARLAMSARYSLARSGRVDLSVLDVSGRRVRTLDAGWRETGTHAPQWDLRDDGGRAVPAGLYLIHLAVDGHHETHRLAVTR